MMKTRLMTRTALAKRVGLNPSTITKLVSEGLPIAAVGRGGTPHKFDPVACQTWLESREATAATPAHLDLIQERARKERAQAAVAEQTFAIRSRTLIPQEEVDRAWGAEVAAVKQILLAAESTHTDRVCRAYELAGVEGVRREIRAMHREALLQFADPNRPIVDPKDTEAP
jgi:phage terminase Nu1 subunit (DNA packaging protein)